MCLIHTPSFELQPNLPPRMLLGLDSVGPDRVAAPVYGKTGLQTDRTRDAIGESLELLNLALVGGP